MGDETKQSQYLARFEQLQNKKPAIHLAARVSRYPRACLQAGANSPGGKWFVL